MYKVQKSEETAVIIKVNDDGSITSFLADEANADYQAYQAWLAEGNTPEPAEVAA